MRIECLQLQQSRVYIAGAEQAAQVFVGNLDDIGQRGHTLERRIVGGRHQVAEVRIEADAHAGCLCAFQHTDQPVAQRFAREADAAAMQPFTRTRPVVRKQFRIEGKVGAVRADEVIARRGGFVDDRQQ